MKKTDHRQVDSKSEATVPLLVLPQEFLGFREM